MHCKMVIPDAKRRSRPLRSLESLYQPSKTALDSKSHLHYFALGIE